MQELNLSDLYPYGEYQGYKLKEVINWNPEYVVNEVTNNKIKLKDTALKYVFGRYESWSVHYYAVQSKYNATCFID